MIQNEKQYKITKGLIADFERTLLQLEAKNDSSLRGQTRIKAVKSEIEDLEAQLLEYNTLKNSQGSFLALETLEHLAENLIKARIAKGMTQAALASKLGMPSQQVQRYEATQYASASLARVLEVARVLQSTKS